MAPLLMESPPTGAPTTMWSRCPDSTTYSLARAKLVPGMNPDNVVRRVGQLSYVTVPRRRPRTWNFGSGRFSESSFNISLNFVGEIPRTVAAWSAFRSAATRPPVQRLSSGSARDWLTLPNELQRGFVFQQLSALECDRLEIAVGAGGPEADALEFTHDILGRFPVGRAASQATLHLV